MIIAAKATARKLIARRSSITALKATAAITNARSVATELPDSPKYPAAAISPPTEASFFTMLPVASAGMSDKPKRNAAKTKPTKSPI